MSYGDFDLRTLRQAFSLKIRDTPLFESIGVVEPSPWLLETLANGIDLAGTSEKARGEFIVVPILMACRALLGRDLRIFSGARLDVDPTRGLNGECDYILARGDTSKVLQAPVMVILEAKKNDIDEGLGQCGAQMTGALLYNQQEGKPVPFVYGAVTTGDAWQFLKLDGDELLIHPGRLPVEELSKILWFLLQCLRDADQGAAAVATA